MNSGPNALLPLIKRLKNCPSGNSEGLRKAAEDSWEALRSQKLDELGTAKRAALTAVIINGCPHLVLERTEHLELLRLANLALQRFEEPANPKNKVGNLIAGALKEQ